jgi:hypothetical protein
MRGLVKGLILLVGLAGGYFLLKPHVVWLDTFEGTILTKVEKEVPTVIDKKHAQIITEYFFVVETEGNRELTVQVDQLLYFRAREGMQVSKAPFTNRIELVE